MRNIKLTNKQITEMCSEFRRQLKESKSRDGHISLEYPLKKIKGEKAEVILTSTAYKKMTALIDQASKEIGWHGTVTRDPEKENRFIIDDILVFPQTVTASTVTPDATEYALWLGELDNETFSKLRFHGHSHVRMGCHPSGTDVDYQENLLENLRDFYIFGIFNKLGKNWMRIYDVKNNILYEDDDIEYDVATTTEEGWAEEIIKDLVKEQTYAAPASYGYNKASYGAPRITNSAAKKTPGEKMAGQMGMFDNGDAPEWYDRYCGR